MTVTENITVADALKAEACALMAQRAGLPLTWQTRAEKRELLAEVDALLEQYNDARD